MSKFTMMAGISGSGKTTVAGLLQGRVHSLRAIQEELGEDVPLEEARAEAERRVLADVAAGVDCIYDARNLSAEQRISFLEKVRACNPDTQCICAVIQASLVELLEQYERRHEYVPIKGLRQMVGEFETPSYHEGWDVIITIQH